MLENILKTIDKKTKEEIAKILKDKETAILELENNYLQEIEKRKREEKNLIESQMKQGLEEFTKNQELGLNFKIQTEKNRILKNIYQKAQERIVNLGDNDYKSLIKKLVDYLPKNKKGELIAGKKTAVFLKNILKSGDIVVRQDLEEEGFIFKSPEMEIDMRFSQMLEQNQEKTNPELVKILFSVS